MRAAIYVRVSTDRQTTDNQEPETLALCQARGWQPTIYRETGSGAKDREVWREVQARARDGTFGAVVAWSIDRVGRNMLNILDALREFDRRGVILATVREPWIAETIHVPALRQLLVCVLGFAAEMERQRTIERIHRGIHTARVRGKTLGRPRALDGDALTLLIQLRAEGNSWRRCGETLRLAGYHRSNGTMWPRSTLQKACEELGATKGVSDVAENTGKTDNFCDPRQVPLFS